MVKVKRHKQLFVHVEVMPHTRWVCHKCKVRCKGNQSNFLCNLQVHARNSNKNFTLNTLCSTNVKILHILLSSPTFHMIFNFQNEFDFLCLDTFWWIRELKVSYRLKKFYLPFEIVEKPIFSYLQTKDDVFLCVNDSVSLTFLLRNLIKYYIMFV